jgi:AbrB family looped-hinge helix DNA binding protein
LVLEHGQEYSEKSEYYKYSGLAFRLEENMPKTRNKGKCYPGSVEASNLKVESIVTVDDRGQMVLPKEIRKKYGLEPGDKLALVTRERDGKVCCIYMFKTEELLNTVKEKLGPLFDDVVKSR